MVSVLILSCFLPCLLRGLTPPHIGGLPSLLVIGHPKSLDHCCLCASVTSLFPSSICLTISPSRFGFCLQHTAVYCLSFYILFYPSSPFVVLSLSMHVKGFFFLAANEREPNPYLN